MPREAQREAGWQKGEEPARFNLGAGKPVQIPGPAESADMLKARRELAAEREAVRCRPDLTSDPHLGQSCAESRSVLVSNYELRRP